MNCLIVAVQRNKYVLLHPDNKIIVLERFRLEFDEGLISEMFTEPYVEDEEDSPRKEADICIT